MTLAVTAGSVGMLLGALVLGLAADTIGRVRTVQLALLVTVVASIGLFFSPGSRPSCCCGSCRASASAVRSRRGRLHRRARPREGPRPVRAALRAGLPRRHAVRGVLATWMVPAFGWRAIYLVGALPIVMIVLISRVVPESPRWLISKGRLDEATGVVERMEEARSAPPAAPARNRRGGGAARRRPLPGVHHPARTAGRAGQRPLPARLVVVCLLWFCGFFVNYGLTSWLPDDLHRDVQAAAAAGADLSLLPTAPGSSAACWPPSPSTPSAGAACCWPGCRSAASRCSCWPRSVPRRHPGRGAHDRRHAVQLLLQHHAVPVHRRSCSRRGRARWAPASVPRSTGSA